MNAQEIIEKEIGTASPHHAYLFLAGDKIFLEEIAENFILKTGCLKEDVSMLAPANSLTSNKSGDITVESLRLFIHELSLSPHGKLRLGLISQAERLNQSSANILLKILEEPPRNVIIILTATVPNVIQTIQSRCRIIRVNREVQPASNTFSYHEFISDPFSQSVAKIEKIVKENQIDDFFSDFTSQIEGDLNKNYKKGSAIALEELIRAQKRIRANANPRLVLENLILRMKAQYGR